MNTTADAIIRPAHTALGLAESLLKDVSPAIFARKPRFETASGPRVIDANHPSFIFGHLALYPQRLMTMMGLDASGAVVPSTWPDLFSAGKECRDDPDGTIYPPMSEVTERFFTSYRLAVEAVGSLPNEAFERPNPAEGRMKTMFPTLGGLANFVLSAHPMMHMGQISTWRRCFGLGPVM